MSWMLFALAAHHLAAPLLERLGQLRERPDVRSSRSSGVAGMTLHGARSGTWQDTSISFASIMSSASNTLSSDQSGCHARPTVAHSLKKYLVPLMPSSSMRARVNCLANGLAEIVSLPSSSICEDVLNLIFSVVLSSVTSSRLVTFCSPGAPPRARAPSAAWAATLRVRSAGVARSPAGGSGMPGVLASQAMAPNEAVFIVGTWQCSSYEGYGESFRFAGARDAPGVTTDSLCRRGPHIVALDALEFPGLQIVGGSLPLLDETAFIQLEVNPNGDECLRTGGLRRIRPLDVLANQKECESSLETNGSALECNSAYIPLLKDAALKCVWDIPRGSCMSVRRRPCSHNADLDYSFSENWDQQADRLWLGPDWFANNAQDWRIRGGRVECINSNPAVAGRTAHLLTQTVPESQWHFSIRGSRSAWWSPGPWCPEPSRGR
ncbi:unnamed protein product [Prorocentrum cordatum]|uniref:PARG catalytic Macro domain-containing protein n=1 Tax=Prorocentrum cordatum TaxID=2364126 RepID=A0ABN9SET7_9DINO|nr:unnamed protein product [Polarella glacialis]